MTEQSLPEESIFLNALDIESTEDRQTFLDQACRDNQKLRAEVEALLRAHLKSGDLLDLRESPDAADQPRAAQTGTPIGPYKFLQQIGEGGMGVVYMAEQHEPVRRKVALKITEAMRRILVEQARRKELIKHGGEFRAGVSVEATVRKAPVTQLNVTQTGDGRLRTVVNEGEAIEAHVLRIGNTMTHVRFPLGPTDMMNQWFSLAPTHHCAMSVGRAPPEIALRSWPTTGLNGDFSWPAV